MAGRAAELAIEIVTAGVEGAVADLGRASGAVKDVGKASADASSKMSTVSDGIGNTGDTAALATTGLRDLGGAMQGMGGTVGAMGTAMVTASTAFEAMDGAATLYAAAQNAASGAATVFNGVLKALRVTILTNPIFIIAAIIVAIVVAIVLLYKNSETARRIIDGAFKAVMSVIKAVWSWVRSNWPLLLAILTGPIGIAVRLIVQHWAQIKAGAASVLAWIKGAWAVLAHVLSAPFEAAWRVIDGIIDSIRNAIQHVLDLIGRIRFPSPPSWLSAVIPGSFAAPAVAGVGRGAAAAPRAAAPVVVNVSGALDPEAVARQVRRILAASDRRGGRLGVLRPVGTV